MSKQIEELVDDEGENQAVRMFLALYGGACGVTAEQMRKHLKMAGFDGAWPEWANNHNGHLTKAGAQLWVRYLFNLERPAQQEPVAWRETYGKIIKALAEIVKVQTPDKVFDLDAIPRDPVMHFVQQIRAAIDGYTPPQRQPLDDEQIADYLGDEYHSMTEDQLRFFRLGEQAAHGITKGEA